MPTSEDPSCVGMKNTPPPLQPEKSFQITCSCWQTVIKSAINGRITVWDGSCTAPSWKKLWHMASNIIRSPTILSHTPFATAVIATAATAPRPPRRSPGLLVPQAPPRMCRLLMAQNRVKVAQRSHIRINIAGFGLSAATSLWSIFYTLSLIHWLEFDLLFFWNVHECMNYTGEKIGFSVCPKYEPE